MKYEKRESIIPEWGEEFVSGNAKYTDDRIRRLLAARADGHSIETSALLAGVDDSTVYNWCKQYPGLREEMRRAKAHFEAQCVAAVQAQVRGGILKKRVTKRTKDGNAEILYEEYTLPDGKLSMEALARRNRKTWGQTSTVLVGEMSDEELAKALEEEGVLERLSGADGAEPGEEG